MCVGTLLSVIVTLSVYKIGLSLVHCQLSAITKNSVVDISGLCEPSESISTVQTVSPVQNYAVCKINGRGQFSSTFIIN